MTKLNEGTIQAIVRAVVVAMDAIEPEEKEEIKLENYVSSESVKTYKMFDDYPDTLKAKDIAAMLNISSAKAYELLHAKGCPVLVIGKTRRVNKESFLNWLKEREGGYLLEPGEGYYSRDKDYDDIEE